MYIIKIVIFYFHSLKTVLLTPPPAFLSRQESKNSLSAADVLYQPEAKINGLYIIVLPGIWILHPKLFKCWKIDIQSLCISIDLHQSMYNAWKWKKLTRYYQSVIYQICRYVSTFLCFFTHARLGRKLTRYELTASSCKESL